LLDNLRCSRWSAAATAAAAHTWRAHDKASQAGDVHRLCDERSWASPSASKLHGVNFDCQIMVLRQTARRGRWKSATSATICYDKITNSAADESGDEARCPV